MYNDDDDLYGTGQHDTDSDSNLVKKLRSKIEELSSRAKELESENHSLKGSQRKQAMSSALVARGYPAKIAAFIPADLEASDEAIDGWLREYGDVFGQAPSGSDSGHGVAQPVVLGSAADADAFRRMGAVEENAQPVAALSGDILSQIQSAGSLDELMGVLRQA